MVESLGCLNSQCRVLTFKPLPGEDQGYCPSCYGQGLVLQPDGMNYGEKMIERERLMFEEVASSAHPLCPFHGINPVRTWTNETACRCANLPETSA